MTRWPRLVAWAALLYLSAIVIGFGSGLTMGRWEIYGGTIEEAVAVARLWRRIAIGVALALLYWRLAATVPSRRLANVLAVFLLVQMIDAVVSVLVFGSEWDELFDLGSSGRALLAALAGWLLAMASGRLRRRERSTDPPTSGRSVPNLRHPGDPAMWDSDKRAELVGLLGSLAFYNDKGIDYARHDAARIEVERADGMAKVRALVAALGAHNLPTAFLDAVESGEIATDSSGRFANLVKGHAR